MNTEQKDLERLLEEIVEHSDIILDDKSQDERIQRLIGYGSSAVKRIAFAISSVVITAVHTQVFENAGLLCHAIGKIGGAEALALLQHFAEQESDVLEYKYIRDGAIRALAVAFGNV